MTGVHDDDISAEEIYADLLQRVHVLTPMSVTYAEQGDIANAVLCTWAADVATAQAVAWERIVVVTHSPQTPFFALGDRIARALREGLDEGSGAYASASELVQSMRERMLTAVDADLADDIGTRFSSLDHLSSFEAPLPERLREAGYSRLGALRPGDFVTQRRADAQARMRDALAQRVRGDITGAISSAYEADMLTLEAYLVESALAIGDTQLLTVQVRWDLAVAALTRLAGVPEDFGQAVSVVRQTLVASIGSGDGARLARTWIPTA
ncbi:MAG: hypothetical protein RL205_131 [Actinomycetota bacterium]